MAKALPIIGILGAVAAAMVVAVVADVAMLVPLAVALAGSAVLLGQRSITGTVAGLLVFLVVVLAASGVIESVTTKNGSLDVGLSYENGVLLALLACLALPVLATILRWDDAEPRWVAIAGLAFALIAFILGATDPTNLADHGSVRALITAILALASLAPMVLLMRAAPQGPRPPTAAPLASADAPVTAKTPARPPSQPPSRRP